MPLLTPSERSALEMMLRSKLGSGAGTTVMLKLFDYVSESYVNEMPSGVGTPQYDSAPLISQLTDVPPLNAPAVEPTPGVTPEAEPTSPVTTGEVAVEVTESSP